MDLYEMYEKCKKDWDSAHLDQKFTMPMGRTPNWEKFATALDGHIEWLKEMEAQDKDFKCDCAVCSMAALSGEKGGMD